MSRPNAEVTTADSAKVLREYASYYNIDTTGYNLRYISHKKQLVAAVNSAWRDEEAYNESTTADTQVQADQDALDDIEYANNNRILAAQDEKTKERKQAIRNSWLEAQADLDEYISEQAEAIAPTMSEPAIEADNSELAVDDWGQALFIEKMPSDNVIPFVSGFSPRRTQQQLASRTVRRKANRFFRELAMAA